MDLTEDQWTILEPLIPAPRRRADNRSRPWRDTREVLNAILWVLRSGARWKDLPERYPPYQTCHRRLQQWVKEGVFARILEALAEDLRDRGDIDLTECFIDGTFAGAKKGASVWEKLSEARERNSWQWQTARVFLSPSTWPLQARTRLPDLLPLERTD